MTKSHKHFEVKLITKNTDGKNIGYLRFNKFAGDSDPKQKIISAMQELDSGNALIIDLRDNIGGDPNLVAFLSSYFLPSNTQLWSILDRNGDTVIEVTSAGQKNK